MIRGGGQEEGEGEREGEGGAPQHLLRINADQIQQTPVAGLLQKDDKITHYDV